MLLSLLGAIAYPLVVSNDSKTAPLRGAVLGTLVAVLVGFFLPTSYTRTANLTMVSMSKIRENADEPLVYQVVTMDEKNQISKQEISAKRASITVRRGGSNEVAAYETRSTFANRMMWLVGIKLPFTSTEIEVPESLLMQVIVPSESVMTPVVVYSNDRPTALASK